MKPVFKCEYCNFIGTEDAVRKHEETCTYNGACRDCESCKYSELDFSFMFKNKASYVCKKGKHIPEGKKFLNCDLHEVKDPKYSDSGIVKNPFSIF